jgi:peptidoglycan hydrolase-like protein with peptidoglycan-binding domain
MREPPRPYRVASERWLDSLERSRRRRAITWASGCGVAAAGRRFSAALASAVVLAAVASVFTTGVADLGWRDVDGASEAASLAIAQDPGVAQRVVKLGSRGEEVTAVERRLDELGFDVKVDRYFDRGTDRAVRRFQHDKGLRVDGVVGRATWHALFA